MKIIFNFGFQSDNQRTIVARNMKLLRRYILNRPTYFIWNIAFKWIIINMVPMRIFVKLTSNMIYTWVIISSQT
jgi:hypothetical protein